MNKIIALWACPRSVSTAFQVALSHSPKIKVVHEPFTDVYYFSKWRQSNRFGEYEPQKDFSADLAVQEIRKKIDENSIVVFKEMAFQALPYINDDFLADITHTFIIRNPQEVIASWYKVDQYPTDWEFGFTALQEMWNNVTQKLNCSPLLVEAGNFRKHPEKVLKHYCQFINVEFNPKMLDWSHGRSPEWLPRKQQLNRYQNWHTTVDNSKGILPPPNDVKLQIRNEDQDMVDKAISIYEKLISESSLFIT